MCTKCSLSIDKFVVLLCYYSKIMIFSSSVNVINKTFHRKSFAEMKI